MVTGASSFGIKDQWQYLNGAQARAVINADGVLGGVYTRHCALLHPGKLVRGLAGRRSFGEAPPPRWWCVRLMRECWP